MPHIENLIKLLLDAATAHGEEEGSDTEAGDLAVLLGGCLQIMTTAQRAALFQLPSIQELLEVFEYENVKAAVLAAQAGPSEAEIRALISTEGPARTVYLWIVGNDYLQEVHEELSEHPDRGVTLSLAINEWCDASADATVLGALAELDEQALEHLAACLLQLSRDPVPCQFCQSLVPALTAHAHGHGHVGDECCWDERLRASE